MMQHWFREQMAMYTAYHRDPRNRATHFIGVPLIIFAILLASSLISYGTVGIGQGTQLPLSLASLMLGALLILYFIAVPLVGLASAAVLIPLLWVADRLAGGEAVDVWVITVLSFVGGWVIQFVGHVFEGRRPALFDNLLQVFMAPGFLIAEILFSTGFLTELKEDLERRSVKFNETNL